MGEEDKEGEGKGEGLRHRRSTTDGGAERGKADGGAERGKADGGVTYQAESEDGEVADDDAAGQIVGAHERDVTPAEEHATAVEVGYGKG